jgi:hypothetical protein
MNENDDDDYEPCRPLLEQYKLCCRIDHCAKEWAKYEQCRKKFTKDTDGSTLWYRVKSYLEKVQSQKLPSKGMYVHCDT